MKLASLISGGKDSVYASYFMSSLGNSVKYIVTVYPLNPDSFMFHSINLSIVPIIADAMSAEHIIIYNRDENKEIEELQTALASLNIDGFVSGAIHSNYQWSRLNIISENISKPLFSPLWRKSEVDVLREEIESGMSIYFSSVSADGLNPELAGKKLDMAMYENIIKLNQKYGINICGEGGEYESVVLDAPFFSNKIEVIKSRKVIEPSRGFWIIDKIEYKNKVKI